MSLLYVAVLTQGHGSGPYAVFALAVSLMGLLPFADLGLGAGVVNAASDAYAGLATKSQLTLTIRKVALVVSMISAGLVGLNVSFSLAGGWDYLLAGLAETSGVGTSVAITFGAFIISIPLGLGARVLQGLNRQDRVAQSQLLSPLVYVAALPLLVLSEAPVSAFILVPGASAVAVAIAMSLFAHSELRRMAAPPKHAPALPPSMAALLRTSVPYFLLSLGIAAGLQLDRIILAQVSTVPAVAEYSFMAQLAIPTLSLITAVSQSLWPRYRRLAAERSLTPERLRRDIRAYAISGAVLGLSVGLAARPAGALLTGSTISVSLLTAASAGAFVAIQSAHQPSAMLLTDSKGLWQQAGLVLAMSAVNVPLTILAATRLGAGGPFLASCVAIGFVQVLPTYLIATRRARVRV